MYNSKCHGIPMNEVQAKVSSAGIQKNYENKTSYMNSTKFQILCFIQFFFTLVEQKDNTLRFLFQKKHNTTCKDNITYNKCKKN